MNTEPWQVPHVELCQDLLFLKKSEMTDIEIRCMFTEHFTTHRDCIQIFTDGSKSDKGVGFAAVFPNQIIKRRLPYDASIFTAELMAILTSLKQMLVRRGSSFVIASDSQIALKSITSFNPEHSLVIAIQELLAELYHKQKCVKFCWVPSHVGIKDNERADKTAKLAIVERQISNISLLYKDMYSSIDMKVKAKALQTWINISNNKLRNIKSCITPWSTSLHRNRCWEVILARLRLGHTRLTHGYLMENGRPPTCSVCNTAVTVEHILISCTKYKTKREVVFKDHYTNGSEPTMKSILQESNIFSVNAIMRFLTEVDLLDKI